MRDGNGTTTFSYYPVTASPMVGANYLSSITTPIAGTSGTDTVAYAYDALDRVVQRTINGVSQTIGFDSLNRTSSMTNALDSFTYSYVDGSQRATGLTSTQGPRLSLNYFGPTGDARLQQITALTNNGSVLCAVLVHPQCRR